MRLNTRNERELKVETVKKVFKWIGTNSKWILFGIASAVFIGFFIWLSGKNRTIKKLETELALIKAKLQLETLALKYDTTISNLKELQKTEAELDAKLKEIEVGLVESAAADIPLEELAKRFKDLLK